jgi:ABC-type Fe3+ transport system substrate-binding protein
LGTYDIASSSVGYLLAAQDARLSGEYGSLIEAMGGSDPRIYQNLSVLLDDIDSGRIAMGYNVLGSYAKRRISASARLRIIYPEDYTLAVVRAAFIARKAPNPAGAHVFMEYLLSLRGQRILATQSDLSAAREEIRGPYGRLGISGSATGPLRPIPIGPGLMTYLDRQKRERFLRNWQAAMGKAARQGNDSLAP